MADEAQPVNGRGLALPEHAATVAAELALTERQVEVLVHELRNALAPSQYWAHRGDVRAATGILRVLTLANALVEAQEAKLLTIEAEAKPMPMGNGFVALLEEAFKAESES